MISLHGCGLGLAALLLSAACQLAGCVSAPASTNAVVTFDNGLVAPSALPLLINRSQGLEVRSCSGLLAVLRDGKDLGELAESPRFNAYADCLAMALINEGRSPRDATFDVQRAGERLYRDLDLAGVASSLAPQRPADHYRLQDLQFDSVRIAARSVVLQRSGFVYTFQVLALGDFRGLGKTELLVRFTDRATNLGSYDKHSVLVVDVTPDAAGLQAIDAIEVLKQRPRSR